jgi:MFS family permease
MGSGGSVNFPSSFNPHHQSASNHLLSPALPKIDPAMLGALIAVLVIAGLVFMVVMFYISSVMRFILFDSVLTKECHVREGWNRRQGPGWNYFLWQLGFTFVTLASGVLLIGVPAAFAWGMGWFKQPREHLMALILGGILMFFVVVLFIITAAVVHVLTKDFVVPQMALEGIGPIEGWRRLWPMIQADNRGYAGYVGMKIVLAIGAGIVVGIATLILALMLAIPTIAVALAAVFTGKSAGLTWNVFTITAAVVAACILFAAFMFLIALISVPVIVFFPAYAIYFFAARYRALSLVLYPPPPAPPPLESPPFPNAPAPA